ncbi:MAG: transcriptional repressor [marine benthic group bacterium]|nr:transcriptional repressor [Gemmatimonadota bacterium]MCL7964073.1 transcriptional repressor [Gemmatimonadota bacterium]MCL7966973.1 transcriptional repressor [Gemmatimonadota bacterium]MCL7968044.1 transcriptional repressor [Gemmatimonadota bacterium]
MGGEESTLRETLLAAGHRCTPQREAVWEVLNGMRTHPTAEEIFRAVRERVPAISLATVYNALESFESAGVCQKLTQGEGAARYDARTEAHHHLQCVDCGRLFDVGGPPLADWLAAIDTGGEFELLGGHLVLEGRCTACRRDS